MRRGWCKNNKTRRSGFCNGCWLVRLVHSHRYFGLFRWVEKARLFTLAIELLHGGDGRGHEQVQLGRGQTGTQLEGIQIISRGRLSSTTSTKIFKVG